MRLGLIGMLAAVMAAGCSNADATAEGEAAIAPQSGAPAGQRGGGAPYEVLGTQVWDVPDPVSSRDYQIFVHLPPSYEQEPQRRYPVLYVTDADYAFPIIRQIGRRLNGEGPEIEEFILIGLSYARGDDGATSRRRDYTPTPNGPSTAPPGQVHGGGAAYQTYLRDIVKPFVADRFRTDPARTLFLGHSYGSLLGAQILLTEPEMFSGYILGSPSLWYDRRHIFDVEAAYAAGHRDLRANVYMYIGEYEGVRAGDERFSRRLDMVADNARFERVLKSRNYPGLTIRNEVLNDEDHLSVAPRGFTHGLKLLLPER